MSVIRQTNGYRAFNFGYFLVSKCVALAAIMVDLNFTIWIK